MITNVQLIGTIIDDLNEYLKMNCIGQYLRANVIFTGIVQKLTNLQKTVNDDLKNREEIIESLKKTLRSNGIEVVDILPEQIIKEGEKN